MKFAMPEVTGFKSYDYHIRLDAILAHLKSDGDFDELIEAGVAVRDIKTAQEILDIRDGSECAESS